ncbi:MAG: class I SAM-dependent methyltransferase [Pseudomonadota bacterium]
MDGIYRRQRLIYDATRKYFLFGRDYLIERLAPTASMSVLEVACGTGRNLDLIGQRYPEARLYGFDISSEMLISARAKLGTRAELAEGDATDFAPGKMFGVGGFDRIVLSYAISMIPDWQAAIAEAVRHLNPGGELHIVDFGDQAGLPRVFKSGLRAWLAKFHVQPRDSLNDVLSSHGWQYECRSLYRGYAVFAVITRAP